MTNRAFVAHRGQQIEVEVLDFVKNPKIVGTREGQASETYFLVRALKGEPFYVTGRYQKGGDNLLHYYSPGVSAHTSEMWVPRSALSPKGRQVFENFAELKRILEAEAEADRIEELDRRNWLGDDTLRKAMKKESRK